MTEYIDFSSVLSKTAIPNPDQPGFKDDYKYEQEGLKPILWPLHDFYLQ